MNYWITTHWPPRKGDNPERIGSGVWLPDGRENAGVDFQRGDKVLIYESRSGRTEVRTLPDGRKEKVPCQKGKEGIIAICEAKNKIRKKDNINSTKYANGTEITWCWHAKINLISRSGFLSRKKTNEILEYKKDYNYHGFGDLHSGLKKISKKTYDQIVKSFSGNIKTIKFSNKKRKRSKIVESLDHYLLKHYVASNPSIILNEAGIRSFKVEFSYPTGDRADILLVDSFGRIIGVEIEINVNDKDYEGLLQAIKYRYMAELVTNRKPGDSRAILIAYTITRNMQKLCSKYDVEFLEVDKKNVNRWARKGEGLQLKNDYKKQNIKTNSAEAL